ncbi:MAG: chromosomal replication initiator protein DnaA [Alphaproteobacteria bacterium]|nr:chromosomal replication initiator protein DnaA [Alphaproteobacteria bacterium]
MQSKNEELVTRREKGGTDSGTADSDTQTQWARVRARLRDEFGEAAFRSWLRAMTLFEVAEGRARIGVPTRFLRDWVAAHYAERIRALWSTENAAITGIDVVVMPGNAAVVVPAAARGAAGPAARPRESAAEAPPPAEASDEKGDFSAPLDPRFTFENFVVGKPNELAHAAARRVAESCVAPTRTVPFNPLFLYGGVGLGKTHLMHAIAWQVRTQGPARKVIYLSAEKFMYQFIRALRFKDTMAFKEQFRSVDLLMIDDVQFISGKDSTQEEFFHTFNALVDQNRQIVISADKSPSDLEGMEERMRSRLGWGLVADIHPTTYELRLGILQAKAEQRKSAIPPKVLEFLAHKITSNVRELEGALNRILAHAQLVGRAITLESAQEVLHDLLRANDRRVTIDEIQKRVAEHYNIRLSDMHSARRARAVARPRQVAMFLCKQLTPRSLPEIGRKFGGRDHTTVMHAVRKIEELRATDRALAEDVELLRRMLET